MVLNRTKTIYLSGIDDLTSFTTTLYKTSNKNLLQSETALTSATLEARLEQHNAQLAEDQASLTDLYTKQLSLSNTNLAANANCTNKNAISQTRETADLVG